MDHSRIVCVGIQILPLWSQGKLIRIFFIFIFIFYGLVNMAYNTPTHALKEILFANREFDVDERAFSTQNGQYLELIL